MDRVLISGDLHGSYLNLQYIIDQFHTDSSDIVVLLGDVGINFDKSRKEYKTKQRLAKKPLTMFCIHGNHEARPYTVEGYEEAEWHGGTVYVDPRFPNQIFAKDGEIYDLLGKKCIVIGGVYSVDKPYRLANGWMWFPDEQPDDEIKSHVEENLEKADWKVDVVFSHTCPYNRMPTHLFDSEVDQSTVDYSTEEWLQTIEDRLEFDEWYFGHYHANEKNGKFTMLFHDVVELQPKEAE